MHSRFETLITTQQVFLIARDSKLSKISWLEWSLHRRIVPTSMLFCRLLADGV